MSTSWRYGLFRPAVHNLIRYHRLIGVHRDMLHRDLLLATPPILIQSLNQHYNCRGSLLRERQKFRTCFEMPPVVRQPIRYISIAAS
jgi:hypothetical protein